MKIIFYICVYKEGTAKGSLTTIANTPWNEVGLTILMHDVFDWKDHEFV